MGYLLQYSWPSLVAELVKNPPAIWETWVRSLGWEDPLEKRKATHSSILAWRIPWTIAHRVAKNQTWLSNFHFHLWFHWPLNTNTAWLLTGNSSLLEGISIDFPEKGGFHMSSGPLWRMSCVFSPQDKVTLRSTCQTQGTLLVLHISTSAIQSLSMD